MTIAKATEVADLPYGGRAAVALSSPAGWFRPAIARASEPDKRKDLIQIQWFVTIACCYLLLFENNSFVYNLMNIALLLGPLCSIFIFLRLPAAAFTSKGFPAIMASADTVLLSTAIMFNRDSPWDLLLVFFFGIFIAAIGENLLQIVLGCLGLSVVSVVLAPASGKGALELDSATLLRIPLLFGASVVYGYLSDQVKQEKRKTARLEAARRRQLLTKDQFLSHVSHELRTPLTAVYQFVTILSDGIAGDLNEQQREYIEIVLRNLNQLQAMVRDLLDATRADSGKLAIDPQMVLLQSFVPQTLAMLMPGAAIKGIALSGQISDELPFVHADPQRVNQILTNLVDNAMKFTGPKGQITIGAEVLKQDARLVHLWVADTGCGIGAEAAKRIFDRLYQEERTLEDNHKGLGLGLHICKELVLRHGGRMWVDSKIGKGSTFHFTLPVYSLTTLLLPVVERRNHPGACLELLLVELGLDKLPPSSEPAKAAWHAAWSALSQLAASRDGIVVLPRMAANEEQGLIFVITTGDLAVEEIKSAASRGAADCAALPHSTCRIAASVVLRDTADRRGGSAERRAAEAAGKMLKAMARIQTEKRKSASRRVDFLGRVSTEIRTPVTAVMGYASILRDRLLGELSPEQEQVVTKVLTEIDDLMLMVSNIFEAERINSPAAEPASHQVQVGEFLRDLRAIYEICPRKEIRMVWHCPDDLPDIISDGNRLKLIMQNVIHAAVKMTARGQVTIDVSYLRSNRTFEFTVAMAGSGFSRQSVQALFQAVAQEEYSAKDSPGGESWGAYLVHACTKLLKGTLSVEASGDETRIKVTLPAKEATSQPLAEPRESPHGVGEECTKGRNQ